MRRTWLVGVAAVSGVVLLGAPAAREAVALTATEQEVAGEADTATDSDDGQYEYYGDDFPEDGIADDEGERFVPEWMALLYDNTVEIQTDSGTASFLFNEDGTGEVTRAGVTQEGYWFPEGNDGDDDGNRVCFQSVDFLTCVFDATDYGVGDSWTVNDGRRDVTLSIVEGRLGG
jgi:hypothetical protein